MSLERLCQIYIYILEILTLEREMFFIGTFIKKPDTVYQCTGDAE